MTQVMDVPRVGQFGCDKVKNDLDNECIKGIDYFSLTNLILVLVLTIEYNFD